MALEHILEVIIRGLATTALALHIYVFQTIYLIFFGLHLYYIFGCKFMKENRHDLRDQLELQGCLQQLVNRK